jgi:hypothetical protein
MILTWYYKWKTNKLIKKYRGKTYLYRAYSNLGRIAPPNSTEEEKREYRKEYGKLKEEIIEVLDVYLDEVILLKLKINGKIVVRPYKETDFTFHKTYSINFTESMNFEWILLKGDDTIKSYREELNRYTPKA